MEYADKTNTIIPIEPPKIKVGILFVRAKLATLYAANISYDL